MSLILFDYGHGGSDPGAVNGSRKEAVDVLKLGQAVAQVVRAAGVTVDETRTGDQALTLADRSNLERKKKYDYFLSFHRNAFADANAHGAETFVYSSNSKAMPLAKGIQKAMVACGFRDRGVKTANFHVLRETRSPAVLLEVGFITNAKDNLLFDNNFNELTQAIAAAILGVVSPAKLGEKQCTTCGRLLA